MKLKKVKPLNTELEDVKITKTVKCSCENKEARHIIAKIWMKTPLLFKITHETAVH